MRRLALALPPTRRAPSAVLGHQLSTAATPGDKTPGRKTIKQRHHREAVQFIREMNAKHEERAAAMGLGWRLVGSRYRSALASHALVMLC